MKRTIILIACHIACIWQSNGKKKQKIFGLTPGKQAKIILFFGLTLTLKIFYGLTTHFIGATIPKEYNVFIGK